MIKKKFNKITYISSSQYPSKEANLIHVLKMSDELTKYADYVDLYVWKNLSWEVSDPKKFYNLKNDFIIKFFSFNFIGSSFINSLILTLKEFNKTTLVYSRNIRASFFTLLFGIPNILEIHEPYSAFSKIDKFLFKLVLKNKNLKLIVLISDELKKIMNFSALEIQKKIIVCHDGAIPNTSSIKVAKTVSNIGYFGSLYKGRGVESIIFKIANKFKNYNFYIVGGKKTDIEYFKKIGRNIKNLNFLGYKNQHELLEISKKIDIFLAPYQDDTKIPSGSSSTNWMSPLKIFEYMSYGKPIISSNFKVLNEVLINNVNSILVKPNDINEWINAILIMVNSKEVRKKLASNALNDLNNKYTWSKRVEKIIIKFNEKKN